jgi:outer membrane protein OmpA-like peptidoglycan-associated protein
MRTLCLGLLVTAVPSLALAQGREPRNFPLERMRPAMDHRGVLDIESAVVPDHLAWEVALWLGYLNNPLVLNVEADGEVERVASVVGHRVGASLVGAIGLYEWVQLGVELPLILYQGRGENLSDFNSAVRDLSTGGTGDLRLAPKVRILRASIFGIDLAVIPGFTLPTASSRAYLGDRTMTFVPEIAVSKKLAMVRLAANLGYRLRPRTQTENLVVDDEVTYRAGLAYDFAPALAVPLEGAATLSGSTSATAPFEKVPRNALEILVGLTYAVSDSVRAFAGGGAGLSAGYSTPDFRVFGGARYVPVEPPAPPPPPPPPPVPVDTDGDGILDDADACPAEPEDQDEFEDVDGCPDPDNDGDGIPDTADACPLQAETANGWEDEDGCPEEIPDTDEDGIADDVDGCKEEPEDRDQFEDEDGCPDPDNDGDGVLDTVDLCPLEPGSVEGGGCPAADRDGDTVIDQLDVCPDTPGEPEFSGCPKQQLVKLSAEKIEILEKVFFATGSDAIEEVSFQLLDSVARVLQEHPEIERIRIEGHTDSRGSAEYNRDLSQRRANAVRTYLADKGVAAERLEAVGVGEDRPIASNGSASGRAANRRVEFIIAREE